MMDVSFTEVVVKLYDGKELAIPAGVSISDIAYKTKERDILYSDRYSEPLEVRDRVSAAVIKCRKVVIKKFLKRITTAARTHTDGVCQLSKPNPHKEQGYPGSYSIVKHYAREQLD